MEPRPNDIQDAIDRYLDNASTLDETRELFDAIAKDATVRQDFQAAAVMRDTFDQELTTTIMPTDLYATIVEQARRQGSLPPVPTAVPSARFWLGIGTLGMLIVGGVTVGVLSLHDSDHPTPDRAATAASKPNQSPSGGASELAYRMPPPSSIDHSEQSSPASSSSPATSVQGVPPSHPRHSRGAGPWSVGGRTHGYRTASTSGTRRSPSDMPDGPTTATPSRADNSASDANGMVVSPNLRAVAYATPLSVVVAPITVDAPAMLQYPTLGASWFDRPPSVTLRMVSMPVNAYSYSTGAMVTASWAVEAEYRLNDVHAIGIGLHNDVMPMQVIGDDGVERSETRMLWSSAHWRATLPVEFLGGVRPWFQFSAGGSSRGAVIEPTVGVGTSVGSITIGLGASLQGFIYQGVDAVGTASRTSLRMDVGYHWE